MNITTWFNGDRTNQLPGDGLFCELHIILILVFFLIIIADFFISKKNHKFASKVVLICCICMPLFRATTMLLKLIFKLQTPVEVLPFHLCHLMAFVIPVVYFSKWKKAYPCVMFYGILGGVMTFLFGDYYVYQTLNFYDVESILLHIMLALVAISSFAKNDFKFTEKNIHYIPLFLLLLCGWASIGNYLTGANYMYIKENGLPFKLLPGHFFFTYLLIAAIIFFFMYLPFIIKKIKYK